MYRGTTANSLGESGSGSGEEEWTGITPSNGMSLNDRITLGVGIGCTMLMCVFMLPIYCECVSDCKKNGDCDEFECSKVCCRNFWACVFCSKMSKVIEI